MKWIIPISSGLLASISLVSLRSIAPDLMQRQLIYFLAASCIFFLMQKIRFEFLVQKSIIFYLLTIFTLLLLFGLGVTTRSTVRWIELPLGFKIQPSQFVPVIVSLLLAKKWSKQKIQSWKGLLNFLITLFLPIVLVLLQPDFGTSVVILVSLLSTLLFSSIRFKQVVSLSVVGVISLVLLWSLILKPYQKSRITSFFNREQQQAQASAYNARQALIAVGSGQVFGRGLGAGVQSHLRFLPERQTDFIFASIAEEWGLVGSLIILCLYFSLLITLLVACYQADVAEHQVIIIVLFVNLFSQIFVNIGMNVGLVPITGLTLPFLSYGGSSIISFSIYLGLVFNVISLRRTKPSLEIS